VEVGLDKMTQGKITVIPIPYDVILNRAHARTFNLQKRIAESKPEIKPDKEITEVLEETFDFDAGGSPKVQ
jgi:c-di-GMP-related signal transduction protein